MSILAQAPSNIALVKYMGKKPGSAGTPANLPENPSLSLTLKNLCSIAEVERKSEPGFAFQWVPELPRLKKKPALPLQVPYITERALSKIRGHFEAVIRVAPDLLTEFGIPAAVESGGRFTLRSGNTFPAGSGIASSASAFAAMTWAVTASLAQDPAQFKKAYEKESALRQALSRISRQGSGSSCRSFEGPWVRWNTETGEKIPSTLPEMMDLVLLVSSDEKSVSSSEAHQRVKSSPLWLDRPQRASDRAERIEQLLSEVSPESDRISETARIAWTEAWEMHSLFHTSQPPFTYWKPETIEILTWLAPLFSAIGTPAIPLPIVTLDAGPNIHMLVPASLETFWTKNIRSRFPDLRILSDHQGEGAGGLA